MGTDYTTYVGPYIQVHNPPKPTIEDFQTCTRKSCPNYKSPVDTKFCPFCGDGTVILKLRSSAPKYIDIDEVTSSKLCEAFTDRYELYLIPNQKTPFHFTFDPIDGAAKDLSQLNAAGDIGRFKLWFDEQLTLIRKLYGRHNVQIKWGILSWAW